MRRALGSPDNGGPHEEQGMPARGLMERLASAALESACLGLAFHVLAYYEEDVGRIASVAVAGCSRSKAEITINDPHGCDVDSLAAAERSIPRLLGAPTLPINLGCSRSEDGIRYEEVTSRLSRIVAGLRDELRSIAASRREYFIIVGWNGQYAMGPGGEDKVELPSIPGVLFIHTHPSGSLCYPSSRDLEAFAGFFAAGGLLEAIVSTLCVYVVRLRSPMTEGCYDALVEASSCIRGVRDSPDEYLACLSGLTSSQECIVAEAV